MNANPITWLRLLPAPVRACLRRRACRRERPVAILTYHRVADLPSDPQLLAVTPAHFAQHLDIVRKLAAPIPLAGVPSAAGRSLGASPCVAVTFDDGYPDNLQRAKPVLQQYAVPATVFVVTGNVDTAREFWWDELERLVLLPRELPPQLDMQIGPTGLHCRFDHHDGPADPAWNVARAGPPGARQDAYLAMLRACARLAPVARDAVLARLADWSGQGRTGRENCRSMTCPELRALRAGGLVTLGAHTVAHPVLARLAPAHQRAEIEAGKRWLEETFGEPVTSFAYPHGTRDAYDRRTVRLVRRAGFACACSTAGRAVCSLDDPFELPRFAVRDWDAPEFERRLKGWLRL